MEHFKDNSGCSGPKKSEIFWNNSRKVQYVFAGVRLHPYVQSIFFMLFKVRLFLNEKSQNNKVF